MKKLLGGSWRHGLVLIIVSLWICACQSGGTPGTGSTGTGGNGAQAGNAGKAGKAGNIGNGGTAGNAGNSATTACSSEGAYRCTDTALEVCQNQLWQPQVACTKDLCDAVRGRCMTCAPGTDRCVAWSLETCASTGDNWTVAAECDTAAYCDSVSKTCLPCLPGETFCSGTRLYVCKQDLSGWAVTDCL